MNTHVTAWFRSMIVVSSLVAGIGGIAGQAGAIQISVTPGTPTAGTPATLTATSCSGCFNYIWTGAVGGTGPQRVHTFPSAGTYMVMVQVTQEVCEYYPYDYCWYEYPSTTKQITVTANEFTVKVIPCSGGMVIAGDGDVDAAEPDGNGIACSGSHTKGTPECQETYRKDQVVSLKVIPGEGNIFLGWRVNGKIVSKEDLLNMLD